MSELSVTSTETADSSKYPDYDNRLSRMHPHSSARETKFGLIVGYSPDEEISERAKLMDFHFDCITRFIPCKNEGEILPEGQVLLEEHLALLKAKGTP